MFNDKYNLTQAVLEGRKTQTRRIIPKDFFSLTWEESGNTLVYENSMGDFIDVRNSKYALCKVDEVVAVAQSYKYAGFRPDKILYRSIPRIDGYKQETAASQKGWSNKMFVAANLMPHQIHIIDVRVERLQDITDVDCLKEGIQTFYYGDCKFPPDGYTFDNGKSHFNTPREAFAHLISKVSKKDVWSENPYVFVYDFEIVK